MKDQEDQKLATTHGHVWESNGEAYGYPKCCIDALCSFSITIDVVKDGKANYSGFRPCDNHAEQINKGEITISSLIDYNKRLKHLGTFKEIWG